MEITSSLWITIKKFLSLLKGDCQIQLSEGLLIDLADTRAFIEHICYEEIKVYGVTTGFGSLRNCAVPPERSALLSENLILSHDAGIGPYFPSDITLGAMILRAISLGKGFSGFSAEGLTTLISMINNRVIPKIPSNGSLGASGDLAFLARLGHAMMGGDVPVEHNGEVVSASQALGSEKIAKFEPKAKEGLALINGTSFMSSMLAIAYSREEVFLENLLASVGVFLNAVNASQIPFSDAIQVTRNQPGQLLVARLLKRFFPSSSSNRDSDVQDDYCIRCLPQIFGPRIEFILRQKTKIENEMNAATDNPLIFRGSQITPDVDHALRHSFKGEEWAVLSGGNFHGENLTTSADGIALANAKIALTIERQITYMLNSWRNNGILPDYLITNSKESGLQSGFMIPHYTANSIVHKVCLLAQPSSLMNCTSGNESEDVVSYGATACHKLLDQISLMEQLLEIYLLTAFQAYSIFRENNNGFRNSMVERMFSSAQDQLAFPALKDESFGQRYDNISSFISSGKLREIAGFPIDNMMQDLELHDNTSLLNREKEPVF